MSTSETIPDIPVGYDEWVDINTESGLSVGAAMEITNKGGHLLYMIKAANQPEPTCTDGLPITPYTFSYAVASVEEGSPRIWLRCIKKGETCNVHVEQVTE